MQTRSELAQLAAEYFGKEVDSVAKQLGEQAVEETFCHSLYRILFDAGIDVGTADELMGAYLRHLIEHCQITIH